MPVIRRRGGKNCGTERQQGLRKPIFYICVIEVVDADIVELGDRRGSVPKTVNDAGEGAVDGSGMEEKQVISGFCWMVLPCVGCDDTLTAEGDQERVEESLEFE